MPKGAFHPLGLDQIAQIAGMLHYIMCKKLKNIHSSLRELFPDLQPAKRQTASNKYVVSLQRGGQMADILKQLFVLKG